MDERVTELESKLAFQEASLQSMSDEMATQQKLIERLLLDVAQLKKEVRAGQTSPLMKASEEPPPPHY
ncbi:SlyX family protein [Sulfuriflexus sp.]|uniref:SlyX family protein n=1 Tax=Sulfuriflexus sp. TaxID=2015443 RepID=UPI0028CDF5AC|nr:SlyX family protein [Sulfuriflexus sp.]MDT8403850.1 SlyX family protein [Sulfuriflexus sp.]